MMFSINQNKRNLCFINLFIIVCFSFISIDLLATNYYVDPSSTLSISNGSINYPWKTISQVNAGTTSLLPGDSVLFKRGQTISGRLVVQASGSASAPIVYSAYGSGNMPELTYTASDIITITNKKYIVIDGLKIIDKTMPINDHTIIAKISYAITLQNAPYCTIKHCEITLVGIAIAAQAGSNYTTIDSNYIHNLRAVRNTIGGDDDYGANAMVIGSSNNIITNNNMIDCWATSYDYGYDGGAVEFFGANISDNLILYNTAINCNGFIEIGSNSNGISNNNLIAYNKIINCGQTGTFHNKVNSFAITINNLKFYNNVIIESKKQFNTVNALFWYSDPTNIDMVVIKNNVIWLTTGENVINRNQDIRKLIHTNNIYYIKNGVVGMTIDSSEFFFSNTFPIFKDTTDSPEYWDYNLVQNSPAINHGIYVGLENDFIKNPIIGPPDIGIFEYQNSDTTPVLNVQAIIGEIRCFGGTANIQINAFGGVPPYIGIGTYIRTAGNYVFKVTDSIGTQKSISITLTQPDSLSISIGYGIITSYNPTTTIYVSTDGGTAPFTYQLDDAPFQASNNFPNLFPGTYKVTVKDANGCLATKTISLSITSITSNPDKKLKLNVYPNPSNTSFNVSSIKYRGSFVTMNLNVYNAFGQIVYSAQGRSNVTYTFGSNFIPGNYVLIAVVDGTVQAVKLLKL